MQKNTVILRIISVKLYHIGNKNILWKLTKKVTLKKGAPENLRVWVESIA